MHRVVFVYARMDSQRLPGKALMPLACSGPLLGIVLTRALKVGADNCALLTSDRAIDDGLAELGAMHGVQVVRGDAFDLVQRTLQAIGITGATHFLRVNGDSPLFSPLLACRAMAHLGSGEMISNLFERSFPYGVAVEWIAASHYKRLSRAAEATEREHVTAHLYRLAVQLPSLSMTQSRDDSDLRLVLDTQADYERLNDLFLQPNTDRAEYWNLYDKPTPSLFFTALDGHR